MELFSLLYVSQCRLLQQDSSREVRDIVYTSTIRNARLGITGALLFTGEHFAQILEGAEPVVAELMAAIGRDPRHDRIQIMKQGPIVRRVFADWGLAYVGPSRFVAGHVGRLLAAPSPTERYRAAEELEGLIRKFSD